MDPLRYENQLVEHRRPMFPSDPLRNFRADWWTRSLPGQQWGSYFDGGVEVARLGVDPGFLSHRQPGRDAMYIIWFEVSNAVRFDPEVWPPRRVGTRLMGGLKRSSSGDEIYLSPTDDARGWWQKQGWSDCRCARCRGSEPLLVWTAGPV
jgi:hypothetical protein